MHERHSTTGIIRLAFLSAAPIAISFAALTVAGAERAPRRRTRSTPL